MKYKPTVQANSFATRVCKEFSGECVKIPDVLVRPQEIMKFRALMSAISSTRESCLMEELHSGAVSKVSFDNLGFKYAGAREKPGCELADVLFMAFDNTGIRITFLQAKSVTKSGIPESIHFSNTEQLVVLKERPILILKGSKLTGFSVDILNTAKNQSIGSFGVFYPENGSIEFSYFSGEILSSNIKSKSPSQTYFQGDGVVKKLSSYEHSSEILKADSLREFCEGLYDMKIGEYFTLNSQLAGVLFKSIYDGMIDKKKEEFSQYLEKHKIQLDNFQKIEFPIPTIALDVRQD